MLLRQTIILRRFLPAVLAFLLGLFIVGARWGWIDRYASDLPYWDQWDAEGLHLLAPWLEHRPFWPEVFHAHNEHRVVLTKLTNFLLTAANGSWDQRLECVFNAVLPGIIAAALFLWSRRFSPPVILPAIWLLLATWGLPLAWPNIINGFHSQQFYLLGFSLGAIAWWPTSPVGSRRWWAGLICAVVALGSMASGFVAAVVAGGIIACRALQGSISRRTAGWSLLLAALIAVAGWMTIAKVDYHASIHAHSVTDFLTAFAKNLQWPIPQQGFLAVILWAPWAWLLIRFLRRPRAQMPDDHLVLLWMGGWVLLQIAATADARGVGGGGPAPRYLDTLLLGMIVNALILIPLATTRFKQSKPSIRKSLPLTFAAAWAALFAWGVIHYTTLGRDQMAQARAKIHAAVVNTHDYLLTNDIRYLQSDAIPYPGSTAFLERINRPSLRSLMPASVRPPLDTTAADNHGFVQVWTPEASLEHAALPPRPPIPPQVPFWSSWAHHPPPTPAEWTSDLLQAPTNWIKIEVIGRGPDVSLKVRDSYATETLAQVDLGIRDDQSWKPIYVHVPAQGFILTARDASAQGWVAFSAPVPVSTLSFLAIYLAAHGWILAQWAAIATTMLTLLALVLSLRPVSTDRSDTTV